MLLNVYAFVDLSDKGPHRQVGVDRVVIAGILGCLMVSNMARSARNMGSILALGLIFPIYSVYVYAI